MAVRVVVAPGQIVDGEAERVKVGKGFTVTVRVL
jgi:hypothetical protein